MKRVMLLVIVTFVLIMTGCSSYKQVPSGYAGKMLTPSGWQEKIYTSGQVDIGTTRSDGEANCLVLVENTSVTVTESFLGPGASKAGEDHRIVTRDDMVPLSVDVRISFMSPDFSKKESDKLFTLITPEPMEGGDSRIRVIRLENIYKNLGKLEVRSAIRRTFDYQVKTYKQALASRNQLNDAIGSDVMKAIVESGVPLRVKSVDLSMMMPDENIWKTTAANSAADAQIISLEKLADKINKTPNGLEIYNLIMMREAMEIGSRNGTNTVIWPISGGQTASVLPNLKDIIPSKLKVKD